MNLIFLQIVFLFLSCLSPHMNIRPIKMISFL
nr:MAG TPA: hypothetical protein [Caudoviricetes sp.]